MSHETPPEHTALAIADLRLDVVRLEGRLEGYRDHREGPETVQSDAAWYAIWGALGVLKHRLGLIT